MKKFILVILLTTCSIGSQADSLFPAPSTAAPGSSFGTSIYSDDKAHAAGDILTVVISENAAANSQATTKTSKNESFSTSQGVGPNIVHLGPLQLGLGSVPALGLGDSTSSTASGATTRSDTLTGEMTVVVTQVLPNGNLVVSGTRSVQMNSETESFTLTGVVRPQDVSAANTVQSSQIADAQIQYGGKGPVGEKQHDGVITRIFKFLF